MIFVIHRASLNSMLRFVIRTYKHDGSGWLGSQSLDRAPRDSDLGVCKDIGSPHFGRSRFPGPRFCF